MGSWKIMAILAPRMDRISGPLAEILEQVLTFEEDLSADDLTGRIDQPHHRELGDGFAAAAFSHHADDLLLIDMIGNIVDGFDQTAFGLELSL